MYISISKSVNSNAFPKQHKPLVSIACYHNLENYLDTTTYNKDQDYAN